MEWILWRNNIAYYNTVGLTSLRDSFFSMQIIRLVMFLLLMGATVLHFFIFFRRSPVLIEFWTLFLLTSSMGCLFFGSGVEKCHQKLIMRGEFLNKDQSENHKKLQKIRKQQTLTTALNGVILYAQALPFVMTINLLAILSHQPSSLDDTQTTPDKWFNYDRDVQKLIMLRYSYFYDRDLDESTWRVKFVTNVHWFCLVVVLAEIIINKIRIPFHHVFYNIILTAIYFACTYVG